MFISVLDLFKIGIGPSSSHTMGPMIASAEFMKLISNYLKDKSSNDLKIICHLKGSLSATGKGHATDQAVALGLNGFLPNTVPEEHIDKLMKEIWHSKEINIENNQTVKFNPEVDIIFDFGPPMSEHPNGMIFELIDSQRNVVLTESYFSIGGGFVLNSQEISLSEAPLKMEEIDTLKFGFGTAEVMLDMSHQSQLSIAEMKRQNELLFIEEAKLNEGLDSIWLAMKCCVEQGLKGEGNLPGGLNVAKRAKNLYQHLLNDGTADLNDYLCAYAMAVNEENASGHKVVTAPTNGAAGVIPAVLYYFVKHKNGTTEQIREFLLTAAAVGGLIKHLSSISGAEVGCQGEVGSASAMAAAALCAVRGGTTQQIENAAEIALEHHLGMTCDPVMGLVQVPCIERNGFGAIKACAAASLSLRGSGHHIMSLDKCIAAMKQTGEEMSVKFKETSLGGLAVTMTEC